MGLGAALAIWATESAHYHLAVGVVGAGAWLALVAGQVLWPRAIALGIIGLAGTYLLAGVGGSEASLAGAVPFGLGLFAVCEIGYAAPGAVAIPRARPGWDRGRLTYWGLVGIGTAVVDAVIVGLVPQDRLGATWSARLIGVVAMVAFVAILTQLARHSGAVGDVPQEARDHPGPRSGETSEVT